MSFVTHLEREPTMVVLMILFGWHAVGYFPPSPSFLPYPYSPGASVDPGFEHPLGAHVRSTVLRVDLQPRVRSHDRVRLSVDGTAQFSSQKGGRYKRTVRTHGKRLPVSARKERREKVPQGEIRKQRKTR
jgi:hypothetical protein